MAFDPFGALAGIVGGGLGFFLGGGPIGAAAGSGLATALYSGDIGKGITSGLLSYGLGSAINGLSDFAGGAAGEAGAGLSAPAGSLLDPATSMSDSAMTHAADVARGAGDSLAGSPGWGTTSAALNAPGAQAGGTGMFDKLGDKFSTGMGTLERAGNNLSNPKALWDTFGSNALKTTVPIGLGIYGSMMDQGSPVYKPQQPQYQGSYPYAGSQGTGRQYMPQQPDPYGRENTYFTPPQYQYAKGGWISGAIKHPGALHRQLGIPEGEKIPASRLASAANSDDPTLARRARLAQTMSKFVGGGAVSGPGGGLDDAIPAIIDGRQPAKLSSGEWVAPAHLVSALGNGSTEDGVRQLEGMADRVMSKKYGSTARKPKPLNPRRMMPA